MAARPWGKFFWADWESDEALRQCSLAAQGLWMRMLCICAKGDPYGYVSIAGVALDAAGLSTAVGRPEAEVAPLLAELGRWGVFSRDRKGRIYSRRMLRDEQRAQIGRKHVFKRWGQDTEEAEENRRPNRAPNRVPKTHMPEAREGKEAGDRNESLNPNNQSSKTRRARSVGYAFEGRLIRLTARDLGLWKRTYHAIPDILAELSTLDGYYDVELAGDDRKRWFIRCAAALDKKHQAYLSATSKPASFTYGVG